MITIQLRDSCNYETAGGGGGGGGGVRWWGGGGVCWMLDTLRGYVGGEYVGGGGGKLGRGGVWDLDPGRPLKNRSKTAQILLEKPFKNHRKK